MLFNSYAFIFVYLPLVFAGMFWLARHSHRLAALWLGIASLAFYAVWDARFVMLLLASIAFNYGAGYWIGVQRSAGEGRQKLPLVLAIAANLLLLGCFKYANFFITSANRLFGGDLPALDIVLPLGISFFTFTQIAFLVDVYRGLAHEYNFVHYLLFVTYFPHLIAGPVLHHAQMMPQFADSRNYRLRGEHVAAGLSIFVVGLAKKVLIADTLAAYATPIFNTARDGQVVMLFEAWIGALGYTLQLYFDFSGYSDMAIGLSLLFNVRLPLNFDSPYQATSIIDFWRRWHITLSTFLRDYLYIPLGGNRKGTARRYANLMATMLLGGLWHGAGWTFVAWGGLHGLYLLVNNAWRAAKARSGWGPGGRGARLLAGALTFLAVVVAWVFFRAESFAAAWTILAGMAGHNGVALPSSLEAGLGPFVAGLPQIKVVFMGVLSALDFAKAVASIVLCLALVWLFPNVRQIFAHARPTWEDIAGEERGNGSAAGAVARGMRWSPTTAASVLLGALFFFCLLHLAANKASEFLYFQF